MSAIGQTNGEINGRSFVIDDPKKGTFLLDREALVSDEVLRAEMKNIFAKCWIYVGHASELKKPGDFFTRRVEHWHTQEVPRRLVYAGIEEPNPFVDEDSSFHRARGQRSAGENAGHGGTGR